MELWACAAAHLFLSHYSRSRLVSGQRRMHASTSREGFGMGSAVCGQAAAASILSQLNLHEHF
jgi:hypothetical protein